jgi:hypothetical protein
VTVAVALTLVLLALTLAVQPWSVLAGILLVASHRGVLKESLYVLGWIIALSVVFAISIAFSPSPPTSTSSAASHWIEIVTGALLGLLLLVRWRKPVATDQAKQPAWLSKLDSMSPIVAFALGAFLPNYLVVVAAAGQILQLNMSEAAIVGVCIVFVLIASLGVAAPLGVLVFKHNQAAEIHESWRLWLIKNSRAVSYGTGGVVCLVLIVKGIVGLLT